MIAWTMVCAALDGSGIAKTLRFSDNKYIDASKNRYISRLVQPALVTVSPSDGGVLGIFAAASVGELELINNDGYLDYLADYAFDGRDVTVALMNDATVLRSETYVASKMQERSGRIFITLRTLYDTLNTPHPFDVYAGNNSLPAGVEGVSTDIKGNSKPKIFGDVRNLSPVLVNTSKLIYQACSRTTTLIGDVRGNGSVLTHDTPDYASLAAMEATAPAAGHYKCFQGYFRLGSNPVGEITCDAYDSVINAGDVMAAILTERSITLDTTSKSTLNAVGAVGLWFNNAAATSYTQDATGLTIVDSTGQGVTTWSMIETIAKSTGAYIYVLNGVVYAKLLDLSGSPAWTIKPHQITRIERTAMGVGINGLPIYAVEINADQIETTQHILDGTVVPMTDVIRYKYKTRRVTSTDSATLTRHPLAKKLTFDSALRSLTDAQSAADRLLAIVKNRTDRVSLDMQYADNGDYSGVPTVNIGDMVTVKSDLLGYTSGRNMAIIGYTLDIKKNKITLELFG